MKKKYSYWLNSGKYSMLQKLAVLFLGVLTFMLLARTFTPAELGVWGLFLVISSIVETSRNALIRNGYILFIHTKEKEAHRNIEYAALAINICFSVLLAIIFTVTASLLEAVLNAPGLATILYIYSLSLLLLIPFSHIETFLNARLDFKGIFWMYNIRNGLLLLVVAVYFFSPGSLSLEMLTIYYGICILGGVGAGLFFKQTHERVGYGYNKKMLIEFLHYGKFVYGNNISSLIFRNTDSFMTASFISTVATAFYTSSVRVANFVEMPSQVLGDIMFPKAAQIMKSGNMEQVKTIYEKTVAATLTFTLPGVVMIFVFAEEILLILAGAEYIQAAPILRVMIFYGVFLAFIRQFGNIMDAMGKPGVNFLVMLIFALINIGTNLAGIHFFGLMGAAYGTITTYFLLFITTQLILKRHLAISLRHIAKYVFILYGDYFKMTKSSFQTFFKLSYEK